jgi:hypothetical protein
LFLLISTLHGGAEQANTPEQLIQDMAAAAKRGNADDFLSHLTVESHRKVIEWLANQAALRRAQEHCQRALDERFGGSAPKVLLAPRDLKSVLQLNSSFELVGKTEGPDGTVHLRVQTSRKTDGKSTTREDTFVARKENGAWKLEMNPDGSVRVTAWRNALERVTKSVQNGEFRDGNSALLELKGVRFLEVPSNIEAPVAFETKNPSGAKSRSAVEVVTSSQAKTVISVHAVHVWQHP